MSSQDQDLKLERLVDHALRQLPMRSAPPALEVRVWDELARRAELPWWRRSFAHWPGVARAAFLAVCASLSALTILGGTRAVVDAGAPRGLNSSLALISTVAEAVGSVAHAIPPLWLYEGLALAAILYAVLVALGAAAYRTLFLEV